MTENGDFGSPNPSSSAEAAAGDSDATSESALKNSAAVNTGPHGISARAYYLEFFEERKTVNTDSSAKQKNERSHQRPVHSGRCRLCVKEKLLKAMDTYAAFRNHVLSSHGKTEEFRDFVSRTKITPSSTKENPSLQSSLFAFCPEIKTVPAYEANHPKQQRLNKMVGLAQITTLISSNALCNPVFGHLIKVADPQLTVRCVAHTLQLCLKSPLEKATILQFVITSLAQIVRSVKQSVTQTEALDNAVGKTLLKRNQTRWNSSFKMAERASEIDWENCGLSAQNTLKRAHRAVLQSFVKIMKKFETVFTMLQTAHRPVICDVIPLVYGLRLKLKEDLRNNEYDLLRDYVKSVLEELEKRLVKLDKDDLYVAAAVLHPKYKLKWCDGGDKPEELRLSARNLILRLMEDVYIKPAIPARNSQVECQFSDLFSFMGNENSSAAT